jgi:hypothetical protein
MDKDKNTDSLADKFIDISPAQRQLITQYLAKFEGKLTAAWHRTQRDLDADWGDSDQDNLLFYIFYLGASEGAEINNECWVSNFKEDIKQDVEDNE